MTAIAERGATVFALARNADALDDRPGYGFINIWTRSLSPEDVDLLTVVDTAQEAVDRIRATCGEPRA